MNDLVEKLKESGISKDDLGQEDYNELLETKIKEAKSFSKGAMVAGGFLLFLELLQKTESSGHL